MIIVGEKWRVTVERTKVDEDDNEYFEPEVVLLGTREQLARFAASVVAEALGNNTSVFQPESVGGRPLTPTELERHAETVLSGPAPDRPKRARRTKAEMEAARAAEDAAKIAEQTQAAGDEIQRFADTAGTAALTAMAEHGDRPTAPFNPFAPK